MPLLGIDDRPVADTPVAVIDFETTGLTAGYDRVVEASVVRVNPGDEPTLAFDSLINPGRPVAATEIHGITDADVRDAPSFSDVADDLREAVAGCIIAAYNVYFDIAFFDYELAAAGRRTEPPYICLMYMRPMLGLGKKCGLTEACGLHGISYTSAHASAVDAAAAAQLFLCYLKDMNQRGIRTYGELRRLKDYKFLASFGREPCPSCGTRRAPGPRKPRGLHPTAPMGKPVEVSVGDSAHALHAYWDALKAALADLQITDDEILRLAEVRRRLSLPDEQVRVLHARAFMSILSQFTHDERLDDKECRTLKRVLDCLSRAGWAPGE